MIVVEAWSARRGKLLHTQSWTLQTLESQVVVEVGKLDFVSAVVRSETP